MTSLVPLPGEVQGRTILPDRPFESAQFRLEREALSELEREAGGRPSLVDRLEFVESPSAEEEQLVAALTDPANDSKSLRTVCGLVGFSVGKFLAFLQRAAGAQALYKAYQKVYQSLPTIAEDAMGAAKTRAHPCVDCEGSGKIHTGKKGRPRTCKTCAGLGQITITPSLKERELALRLGGMLEGPTPPPAQTVVNVTAGAVARAGTDFAGSHLTRFVGAADKALLRGSGATPKALEAQTSTASLEGGGSLERIESSTGLDDPVVQPLAAESQGLPVQPKKGLPTVLAHGKKG